MRIFHGDRQLRPPELHVRFVRIENVMSDSDIQSEPVSGFSVFYIHTACLVACCVAVPTLLGVADSLFSASNPFPALGRDVAFGLYFSLIFFVIGFFPLVIHSFFYSAYADNGEATYLRSVILAVVTITAGSSLTFIAGDSFEGNLKSFFGLVSFGYPVAVPTAILGHYFCNRLLIHKPNPSFNGRRGEPQ